MKYKECEQKTWQEVKIGKEKIQMRYYGNKTYKKTNFMIFLNRSKQKGKSVTAGMMINLSNPCILIDSEVYKEIPQDEFDSLVKHEMLHAILGHKNKSCTKKKYLEMHRELYEYMTKIELIHHQLMSNRFAIQ